MVPRRFQGTVHLVYRSATLKGSDLVKLAKTTRTLLIFCLLALFTQASVAAAVVHQVPQSSCGAELVLDSGHHASAVAKAGGPCQPMGSQDSGHSQHSSSQQADCCLDCQCSLNHCSTSAAITENGLASWPWASRQAVQDPLLPANPPLANLFRPPILG